MGIGNQDQTALSFDGDWRELLPIALSNLFLTIVTLGFYRFWGTVRERQYLWSKTRFIDDTFEWTGTGLELFFGFLIALLLFGLPFLVLNLILQGLALQGYGKIAGVMIAGIYIFLLFLAGVATFRGLRYRLSRTYWHGIHGGSDDAGWHYGWSWLWKNIVAYLCAALLFPWSMVSLWKQRWESMSFGPHKFHSAPEWGKLMPRYLLAYVAPFAIIILLFIVLVPIGMATAAGGIESDSPPAAMIALIVLAVLAFYVLWPLAALVFYAAYLREVINTMRRSTLEFEFTARTKDWVKLFLGNVGLWILAGAAAMIPLGAFGLLSNFATLQPGQSPLPSDLLTLAIFGVAFAIPFGLVGPLIRYRNWSFFVRHLEAGGEINLASLTQSNTREIKQGEGLLDAFDMGAI
ncbi:MAG: YjgN family protein [Chakrabartia sp.]